ncbi:Testis-specific serine/threonine-protein kinase 4 [Melipona quadrifasciata]|uniref:Testis-specific serine/threonine-protein kinase 4 n=1 Tax=Melipona quadrifasciata TaxID=166423 RepID=A0A0N0BEA6_9HYME|nr:Testis-specific serine/threonine-protein kinase 4 [Melipona quadrifasciata]
MATASMTDKYSDTPKASLKTTEDKSDEKSGKKLTVLESHGYTIGKTIGAGSYATVKIAKSDRHDCQVAVKIVSKFQAPGDYLKKFLPREIEVVKGLKHPNLIRFLQAIETTHRVYIIMEYAQCGSLLDAIRRDTFIDEFRSRRWFRQLLEAVAYCHERGVVHRDVKCENVLMDRNLNIKLSDFGFARGQMKPKNGIAPLSETFCGSYAYASPEILKGVAYLPQLSDVWSMGVQVQNKVTFPKEPNVSQACRSLISRILVPQRIRLDIDRVRNDIWLSLSLVDAQTSTTDVLKDVSVVRDARNTALKRSSGTFKGAKKHSTAIGARIIDVRSSNFNVLDENNNRYRRNFK